jgi:hypothetical protein
MMNPRLMEFFKLQDACKMDTAPPKVAETTGTHLGIGIISIEKTLTTEINALSIIVLYTSQRSLILHYFWLIPRN